MGLGRFIVAWMLAIGLGVTTVAGWLVIPHAPRLDPLVMVVLWFNIGLMLLALGVESGRRPYSLHLMHLICMYLFLGAASVLQYSRGILGVPGPIRTVQAQILPAAAATTLWLAGYLIAYEARHRAVSRPRAGFLNRQLTLAPVFLLTGVAVLGLAFLAAAGLLGAGTRGAADEAIALFAGGAGAGALSQPLYIITANLARALSPIALLAALLLLFRDPRSWRRALWPSVLAVGIGTLLVNNPFAASRMFLTCSLIAFSAPFFLRRFETGWPLVISILIALAFLPALGAARHALDFRELRTYLEIISPLEYLATNSDVDSLGMTALCQKWVDKFGIRWGLQLLSALVFWIPRAYWPGKPLGTGSLVTGDLGFVDNTNLAPPITAEALVNFGLIGVPLCGAIFGLILARLDTIYWAPGRAGVGTTYRIIDASYPFWLVCIVYFTRGDFLPALVFTVSFSIWLVPLGFGSAWPQHAAWPSSRTAAAPGAAQHK